MPFHFFNAAAWIPVAVSVFLQQPDGEMAGQTNQVMR
jgi:hypothetical protein